jgi:hypothetical protein
MTEYNRREQDRIEKLQAELADVRADAVLLRSEIARLKDELITCRELRKYDRIEVERLRILLDRK